MMAALAGCELTLRVATVWPCAVHVYTDVRTSATSVRYYGLPMTTFYACERQMRLAPLSPLGPRLVRRYVPFCRMAACCPRVYACTAKQASLHVTCLLQKRHGPLGRLRIYATCVLRQAGRPLSPCTQTYGKRGEAPWAVSDFTQVYCTKAGRHGPFRI